MSRIRKSGGYRKPASFQSATLVYDATYWFCEQFLDPRSRTVDQMVQAKAAARRRPGFGGMWVTRIAREPSPTF